MFQQLTRKLEIFSAWSTHASERKTDSGRDKDKSWLNESVIDAHELEARILYSAAPVPVDLVIEGPTEAHAAGIEFSEAAIEFAVEQDPILSSQELGTIDDSHADEAEDYSGGMVGNSDQVLDLVFVDESVAEDQRLIDGIWSQMPNALIFRLSSNQDGIEAMTSILAERTDVRSVHILSHGDAGEVQLGNASLSSESLATYADELSLWKNSLTSDADVFFYGCELAGDAQGEQLVGDIAQLTGADVAASDDLTGHHSLGGDWDLEYEVGQIDSEVILSANIVNDWEHTLAVAQSGNISTDATPARDLSDGTAHTTLAGSDRLLLVGVSFGQTQEDFVSSITYNGDSLIRAGAFDNSDSDRSRVEIWYRVAPDVGTDLDLDITYSGDSHRGATYGIVSLTGVDQANPFGAFVATEGDSDKPSVTISSAVGELVFGVVALHNQDVDFTPGGGQTELWDLHVDRANGAASLESGSANVVTSWDAGRSDEWVAAGVSIRPVALIAPETQTATASGNEDETVAITLAGTDADGTVNSFSLSTLPSNGMLFTDAALTNAVAIGVDYAATGESLTLYFDPDTDWHGSSSFNFLAKDNDGQSDSSPATGTITVSSVNDDPRITSNGGGATAVINIDENQTFVTTVAASDTDNPSSALNYSILGGLDSSHFVIDSMSGDLAFINAPDYENPTDRNFDNDYNVRVHVDDGSGGSDVQQIRVIVQNGNERPYVAGSIADLVINEDSINLFLDLRNVFEDNEDADSDLVYSIENVTNSGIFTSVSVTSNYFFTLNFGDNQNGSSIVTIRATDTGGLFTETTSSITINPVNDDPFVASPVLPVVVDEDSPNTRITLGDIFDDVDILTDGDSLTYRVVSNTNGALVAHSVAGNQLNLDYLENQYGQVQIVIEASDIGGLVASDTITLNVMAVNDRPEVVDHVFRSTNGGTTNPNRQITGNLLAGATDIENDSLTVSLIKAPDNGVINLNPDGTFTFTPDANFFGPVTIEFEASDGVDVSDRGTATFITDQLPIPSPTEDSSDDSDEDEDQLVPVALQQVPEVRIKELVEVTGGMAATFASFQSKVAATEPDEALVVVDARSEVGGGTSNRQIFSPSVDAFVRSSIEDLTINKFDYSAEFSASLTAFGRDLDEAGRELEFLQLSTVVSISGVSIGFMSLVLRTGAVVASMMVNVPAWRLMDPLCVLGYSDDDADDEDESLLDIVESENTGATRKVLSHPSQQGMGRSRLTPLKKSRQQTSPVG